MRDEFDFGWTFTPFAAQQVAGDFWTSEIWGVFKSSVRTILPTLNPDEVVDECRSESFYWCIVIWIL
jgi:hypothetical protein